MSYITTYKKIKFDPTAADPKDIDIADIAHALSFLCRANGHFPCFYSVGMHCLNCMNEARTRGYSKRVQLGCLLHDASEAYLSDITRPIKPMLTKYLEIEKDLQNKIYDKWLSPALSDDELCLISDVDDAILYYEFLHMMGEKLFDAEPVLESSPDLEFADFGTTENDFLYAFERLTRDDSSISVGVDWLKGRWIAAELCGSTASYRIFDNISDVCKEYEALPHILIDVPIGLPESREEAELRPDKEARKYLKIPARKSSVFPVPFRQLVYAEGRDTVWKLSIELDARITSMGIGILPCIRQVDLFLEHNPLWRDRLVESHPECAFQALNKNCGIINSKHSEEGILERMSILSDYVSNTEELISSASKSMREDLLDALCLAVSANMPFRSVKKEVHRDSRGLPMRIVIPKQI